MALPGLTPIVADTDGEAHAREEARHGKLDFATALVHLAVRSPFFQQGGSGAVIQSRLFR